MSGRGTFTPNPIRFWNFNRYLDPIPENELENSSRLERDGVSLIAVPSQRCRLY